MTGWGGPPLPPLLSPPHPPSLSHTRTQAQCIAAHALLQEAAVAQLTSMGFTRGAANDALRRSNFDVGAATNLLLG